MGSLTLRIDADRVGTHSARRGAITMRFRSRLRWFVAVAVLGYAASPAGAQTPSSGGPPAGPSSGQVGFQGRVNLTPEQQVAEAETISSFVSNASQVVSRRLQAARQEH